MLIDTERAKHASELAKQLSLEFDALVLLSGDGLLHEVYNGFAEHEDPITAFSIPVAPIPTGSANGMAINLLGLEVGFSLQLLVLLWLMRHYRMALMLLLHV